MLLERLLIGLGITVLCVGAGILLDYDSEEDTSKKLYWGRGLVALGVAMVFAFFLLTALAIFYS
jgi:hypothetical protein